MNYRPMYYSRQGRPLSRDEWANSFENMTKEARIVRQTYYMSPGEKDILVSIAVVIGSSSSHAEEVDL